MGARDVYKRQEWKDCYEAGIFTEFMEQRAPGHTVADGKMYQKGFLDFKKEIEDALNSLDFLNDLEACEKQDQLRAMSICCDAIIRYGERHAEKALELAENEQNPDRKKELMEIAEVCSHVPANAPRTFHEALQMYWFVHIGVITELNTWDSFNPGRLDQHLYPFYKKEVEAGTLSREDAKELLQCFWVKFNNQPAPPKVGITLSLIHILKGAAEYEQLLKKPGSASVGMDAQSITHLLIVLFVVVGNIQYFVSKKKGGEGNV